MDVIAADWEKGIVVCSFHGQVFISLIEDGDLIQNTGRRDKYRKEIYDKDILFEHDELGGKKLEVFWGDKVSGFRCRRDSYTCPITESKNIEVIGNSNDILSYWRMINFLLGVFRLLVKLS
jgi:hypothetical protein